MDGHDDGIGKKDAKYARLEEGADDALPDLNAGANGWPRRLEGQQQPGYAAGAMAVSASGDLGIRPQRKWDGHWLNDCMCGGSDTNGTICCATVFCPCIVFGLNKSRLFGVMVGIIWGILYYVPSIPVIVMNQLEREKWNECEENFCDDKQIDKVQRYLVISVLVALVYILWRAAIGTYNRAYIRTKYNITESSCGNERGSIGEDFLLWCFCNCCALYQEARTLSYNKVRNGVWNGPSSMFLAGEFRSTAIPISEV